MTRALCLWLLLAAPALAQERPDEDALFGGDDAALSVPDAGVSGAPDASDATDASVPVEAPETAGPADDSRDAVQLSSPTDAAGFERPGPTRDALKVGGTLNLFTQALWQEGRDFTDASFSAPTLFDFYLDGRPTERVRGFVGVRLQYDPTRPLSSGATAGALPGASSVGLLSAQADNPALLVDQLWLRFDIARRVFLTVGRQKVRWGVSHIWYPTDFLNAQPRDALNPLDARLGVNLVKVHVPVESLGWNFYAYGLLDAVSLSSAGMNVGQLGGALRGEFVLGPAEVGLGAAWQRGRRPRYALDVSSALGPVDVYAEAALRSGKDFALFRYPDDLVQDDLVRRAASLEPWRPDGPLVLVSGGLSWQFHYTDKNVGVLVVEYFYNPAGYDDPIGYQVGAFAPLLYGVQRDPVQELPLYGGKHNVAVSLLAPGLPRFERVTLGLSTIIIANDPSALTRLDFTVRVFDALDVQAFAGLFSGQTGGQLRFSMSPRLVSDIANLADAAQPGAGAQTREALRPVRAPPRLQAGLLLRVSI